MRRLHPVLVGTAVLLLVGCSISESVKSSFESSAASSGSSSSSSGSSSADRASYRSDVRDYTSAYVKSGAPIDNFDHGLQNVAERHHVTNWENDQDTYVGIGEGLRAAGVTQDQYAVWQANLAAGDATKAASMQKGYSGQ